MNNGKILDFYKSLRVRVILLAVGILTIIFSHYLTTALPYIIGTGMCLFGITNLIVGIARKKVINEMKSEIANALIILILGVAVFLQDGEHLAFIGIIWALISLMSGASELNKALYHFLRKEKFLFLLIQGSIEVALSMALLFDPFEHLQLHVVFLGITMIVYSIKSPDLWLKQQKEIIKKAPVGFEPQKIMSEEKK
ncbi:MAG: DUF308 domain-containing protein [Methanocorpusculum sp.]|nr:DUF308 domain-containing protein [Methanocorpusculum sp.]